VNQILTKILRCKKPESALTPSGKWSLRLVLKNSIKYKPSKTNVWKTNVWKIIWQSISL